VHERARPCSLQASRYAVGPPPAHLTAPYPTVRDRVASVFIVVRPDRPAYAPAHEPNSWRPTQLQRVPQQGMVSLSELPNRGSVASWLGSPPARVPLTLTAPERMRERPPGSASGTRRRQGAHPRARSLEARGRGSRRALSITSRLSVPYSFTPNRVTTGGGCECVPIARRSAAQAAA
jgi:hypothetical protein